VEKHQQHIVIAGGSGFIGNALSNALVQQNKCVTIISRNPEQTRLRHTKAKTVKHISECCSQPTHFINLAGAGIADKRWSRQRKQHLLTSRLQAISEAANWLANQNILLDAALCGSAIGYYGFNTLQDPPFNEASTANNAEHFSHQLCKQVEENAQILHTHAKRTCLLRTGVVIGPTIDNKGGALQKMRLPALFCMNGKIGTGQQMISWIHMTDMVNAIIYLWMKGLSLSLWRLMGQLLIVFKFLVGR